MPTPRLPRAQTRIGVLVPFTNTNLEPDLHLMCPPDTSLHITRIGGYRENDIPDAAEMARMGDADIDGALALIAGCHPDAVLYGCTSATLAHGRAFDIALAQRIRSATGAVTITAAGAIVFALKALGVTKVGLATPYVGVINNRTIQFLADEGLETLACGEVQQNLLSHEQGALSPGEIEELAKRADHTGAQAVVLACTDLRAIEAIPRIEAVLSKPVVTSNQAMMFMAMVQLGLEQNLNSPGLLFQSLSSLNPKIPGLHKD